MLALVAGLVVWSLLGVMLCGILYGLLVYWPGQAAEALTRAWVRHRRRKLGY